MLIFLGSCTRNLETRSNPEGIGKTFWIPGPSELLKSIFCIHDMDGCSVFWLEDFYAPKLEKSRKTLDISITGPTGPQAQSDQLPFFSIVTIMSFDGWVVNKNRRKLEMTLGHGRCLEEVEI